MRTIMYAILAVPVIAAILAGISFFPTTFGTSAVAAPEQPVQANSQPQEQEDEGVTEQNDDSDGVNDNAEESVDTNLATQVKITANEAGVIAANYLSVQPSAVQSIELENEGDLHYSVALVKDNHTIDIEVNANTGTVGNVEQDD